MSDLTKEQLEGMDMWGDDREVMFTREHQAVGAHLVGLAVAEIQRRRAEQAAGRGHVELVVSETINAELDERKLYVVKPQHPTMGEIALEAYGHGRACDAVAFQGDDLQALLSTVARRVADRLSVPVLSEEERAVLVGVRSSIHSSTAEVEVSKMLLLLDRLIAAGKP